MCKTDRVDYWRSAVSRHLVDLDCSPSRGQDFEASIEGVRLPDLSLCRIDTPPHAAHRTTGGISRSASDALVLNFVVSGKLKVEQDGRAVELEAGNGALCDADRRYEITISEHVRIAAVRVPRGALSHRPGRLQGVTAIGMESVSSLCPLVFGYLVNLTENGGQITSASCEKVSRNFTQLVSAMIDEAVAGSAVGITDYKGRDTSSDQGIRGSTLDQRGA
jgi:hypothetical protein